MSSIDMVGSSQVTIYSMFPMFTPASVPGVPDRWDG